MHMPAFFKFGPFQRWHDNPNHSARLELTADV